MSHEIGPCLAGRIWFTTASWNLNSSDRLCQVKFGLVQLNNAVEISEGELIRLKALRSDNRRCIQAR